MNLTGGFAACETGLALVRDTARSELSAGMELSMKSSSELFELFERLSEDSSMTPHGTTALKWSQEIDSKFNDMKAHSERELRTFQAAEHQRSELVWQQSEV